MARHDMRAASPLKTPLERFGRYGIPASSRAGRLHGLLGGRANARQSRSFGGAHVTWEGYETFVPKTKVLIGARWRAAPLFVGYFFVRIVDRWRVIERTIGVLGLVKFGDTPARCPDAEIAKLRTRADADGLIRLPWRRIGDRVRIVDGPFTGVDGLYAGMSARDRELVLISLLGRQTKVELRPGQLAAAP
jgi:transcriptional antiterminator RfaH